MFYVLLCILRSSDILFFSKVKLDLPFKFSYAILNTMSDEGGKNPYFTYYFTILILQQEFYLIRYTEIS